MTITERVEHLEDMMNRVLALEERLLEMVGNDRRDLKDQEQMLNRLLALEERSMEIHADTRTQLAEQREYFEASLAEQREDSKKIHRLWVRLAQKHGWIDDEDIL